MSSSVFFRFKSQKEPSRIAFDGTGISVFELKRDIIAANKLGDGTDFELVINAEDTNEEYDDDTAIVPRSTTVIARRLPAAKAGRGGAARYVSGKMPQNAKSSHKTETTIIKSDKLVKPSNGIQATTEANGAQSEEQRIAAMFQQGADQWAQQQQAMASATPVFRGPPSQGKHGNVPDKPLPPGYICYRCGEKGHYIHACPTNNDPEWDKRPRIKRTTGIPKSFLKTIEKPTAIANDGTMDDTKHPAGVMVTADGEWVIAEPDKASWDQYQAKAKVSAAAQEAAARGSKDLQERGLECSIDNRLFIDPTKTPCCQRTYCNECITNSLLENDLTCPSCSTENILIDDLLPDAETAAKVREFEEEKAPQEPNKQGSINPPKKQALDMKKEPSANGAGDLKSPPAAGEQNKLRAKTPDPGTNEGNKGKKRPAELEVKNDRNPPGPSALAMAKQPSENGSKQTTLGTKTGNALGMPQNPQMAFSKGNYIIPQGLNAMAFPNMNGFMGMPMQTNAGLFNPAMIDTTDFMNGAGGSWNGLWAQNYPQQAMGTSGPVFQQSMYPAAGYNSNNMPLSTGNSYSGSGGQGHGRGHFPNQQRSHFHGQNANDEDSAYFRKPVNPHRHQGRRNLNRPADYREV